MSRLFSHFCKLILDFLRSMTFDYSAFIQQNIFILYLGILFVAASIVLFEIHSKKAVSVLLLIIGATSLRIFVGLIDPFLHQWDEQFHALVAKNMMNHLFKPTFFEDPVLPYNYKNWTGNHIWLHKQPLFLWQIALSYKLFGVNEFAVRIPSIIMSAITVYFIYRIGKIAYSKRAGFYGAVLFAGSNFLIELTAGRAPTDHNDITFLFYVTAGIWAWFEYTSRRTNYWLLLIGLFAGLAILDKWLTGLLVYSGWFIYIIFIKERRLSWGSYIDLLKSLLVTIVVALPWQLYILLRFPEESRFEYALNSRHFFEAIESHSGSWLYHIDAINIIYGFGFGYLIIASLVLFCLIRINNGYKIPMLIWVFAVYGFFTLAATKMIGFTIIVAPLIYLIVGIVIAFLINYFENLIVSVQLKKWLPPIFAMVLIFCISFYFMDYTKLSQENVPERKKLYASKIKVTLFYKELNSIFPEKDLFYYNSVPFDNVKIMYYTGHRSRGSVPKKKDIIKI